MGWHARAGGILQLRREEGPDPSVRLFATAQPIHITDITPPTTSERRLQEGQFIPRPQPLRELFRGLGSLGRSCQHQRACTQIYGTPTWPLCLST